MTVHAHRHAGVRRTVPRSVHDRRWAILGVLVLSLLVVVLDNTVLNVALPRIEQELGASQSQQEWIIDAYTLVFAALLFPYGVLADRRGRRRVLLWGMAVFGVGSLLCAYSVSPGMLIAMRAVMGLGGAAVFPATLAIITNVFDDDERPRAIAIWAGASGLAVGIGPLVGGGLLSGGLWWGSVFLINVPIVAIAIPCVLWLVPESRDPDARALDPWGVLLSMAGLLSLVYGLIRAGETSDWTNPGALVAMVAGVAVLAVFAWHERRLREPALDVGWFRNPSFSAAVAALGLVAFSLFGVMLFGAYYLQFDRGFSPLQAGALLVPLAVAIGLVAPFSAMLAARIGVRAVLAAGLGVIALAFASFATVDHGTSLATLEAILFVLGVGNGMAMAPATAAILQSLPVERAGAGSAVNSTVRQVGGALGVAVLGSVLSTVYRSGIDAHLAALPAGVGQPAGESIGATQAVVGPLAPLLPDHGAAIARAASDAFIHATHVTAVVSAAAVVVGAGVVVAWMPRRTLRSVPALTPGNPD